MLVIDLNDCASPEDVVVALRSAADAYHVSAGDLVGAWQDRGAGAPWSMIARELERCANRIASKL